MMQAQRKRAALAALPNRCSKVLEADAHSQLKLARLLIVCDACRDPKRRTLPESRREAFRVFGESRAACVNLILIRRVVARDDARVETSSVGRVEDVQDRRLDPWGQSLENRNVVVESEVETALTR